MLCTGCGKHAAVIGRFCGRCDLRARNGRFERRRPVGGGQWQALWGISYAEPDDARWRRRLQGGGGLLVAVVLCILTF